MDEDLEEKVKDHALFIRWHLNRGNYANAEKNIKKALESDGGRDLVFKVLKHFYNKKKHRTDEAIEYYYERVRSDPSDIFALFTLGFIYHLIYANDSDNDQAAQEFYRDKAGEMYEKVIELDPENIHAISGLSVIYHSRYMRTGDPDQIYKTSEMVNRLIELKPEVIGDIVCFNYFRHSVDEYLRDNQPAQAEAVLDKLAEFYSKDGDGEVREDIDYIAKMLIEFYLNKNQPNEAKKIGDKRILVREKDLDELLNIIRLNDKDTGSDKDHEKIYMSFRDWFYEEIKNLGDKNPERQEELGKLKEHSERVLELIEEDEEELSYEAKIAALGHDIERAYEDRVRKKDFGLDDEYVFLDGGIEYRWRYTPYKEAHAKHSAEIVAEKLKKLGASRAFTAKVSYTIKYHDEDVGDYYEHYRYDPLTRIAKNIVKCDAVAFLGSETDLKKYLIKNGAEALKGKIKFMKDKVSSGDTKFRRALTNAHRFLAKAYKTENQDKSRE